jgi:YVTN family beta-propeller protein
MSTRPQEHGTLRRPTVAHRRTPCREHLANLALAILLTAAPAVSVSAADYLGPIQVLAAKDGKTLYVLELDAGQIAVVDPAAGKVLRTITPPARPTGVAVSPDGGKLYVTCATPEGSVAVIDAASGKLAATIPVGHSACGPAVAPDGKRLYVCNRFNNNVSVIDLAANRELTRLPVVREPVEAVVTPDGKSVFVANLLPNDRSDGADVAATISVIDAASNQVSAIRLLNGSTSLRGLTVSPDGKYVYVVHVLSRYQMPTTQLERGWMNTNALTILDAAARKLVNTVLLDDVDLGAANPWGVAATADGLVAVTHAGSHELSLINAAGVLEKIAKVPVDEKAAQAQGHSYDPTGASASAVQADIPNDLAFLVDLKKRIKLEGNGPRGLAIVGGRAYVAMYFSDTLGVVDLASKAERTAGAVALGPAPKVDVVRKGDIFFHDAGLCFQQWQSCSTCHPDARMDALNWDLMNDGIGNPKNGKSLLWAHKTPPSMWLGVRPNAESAVRSGITHIQFAVRPEEDAAAIDAYLKSLEPLPSPYLVHGQISESAKRGKELFNSARIGCAKCHPAPLYTDLHMHDVASAGPLDRNDKEFDTPSLVECWRTAPYLHDGHWLTIKELLKEGKHGNKVGPVEKLTEQELNDLAEFVLSL